MLELDVRSSQKTVETLKSSGVIVARTDTIYGLLACASDDTAVKKVYELKGRRDKKPCIILISSIDMLYNEPEIVASDFLRGHWPGPVSVILPALSAPNWLRRGGETLAYRLPDDPELRDLINQTGPLIAPSANPEGLAPAKNINEAREYFGDAVDMYVDGGTAADSRQASQLWQISPDGTPQRLR